MVHYDVLDGACMLRLDAPPLNTLTHALLAELDEALARAQADPAVLGIVLTGGTEHFSAGADIDLFKQLRSADDAVALCRLFQEAFDRIENSAKPVVAALGGNVLGGALELAMACHYRVASIESRFGMPEIRLGFNPGAGGTQRLTRLVGPELALRMLLGGEPIPAEAAQSAGLIDAACPRDLLLDEARSLARSTAPIRRTRDLAEKIAADRAVFDAAERRAAEGRPEIIAPTAIIAAVRAGVDESFEAGLRAEREGFAACIATRAAQNKIYLFFAGRQAAKALDLAGVEPRPISRAAVVGSGTMGTGIAQALLAAGLPVAMYDEDQAAIERGRQRIRQSLVRRVDQGKLSQQRADETLDRLSAAAEWSDLAGVDLVVEAVFEDLAVKRAVFDRLEDVCRSDAVLGSNTSTISLDDLSQTMRRPERLVGLHFFNPAYRMPLLEVIRPGAASAETLATAMQLARRLKKTAVLVKNRAGFIVSRLFVPYLKEAFWLLEEGAAAEAIDRAMVDFGFPMGPLALIDMAGLDILALTDAVLRRAFPRHGELPPLAARLVERGRLGQKTGSGVYRYVSGDHTPQTSHQTQALLDEVRRQRGVRPRVIDHDEITRRLVLRMVAEASWVLDDRIAQRPSDLDVAMVLGIGFPDFRGGVVRYTEDLGADRVAAELDALTAQYGPRFTLAGK